MTGTKTTSGFTMLWATEEMVNEHPISADTSAINDIESGAVCTIRAKNCVLRGSEQRLPQNRTWLRRKRHPILGLQFDQPNRVPRRQRVVFGHGHQKVLLGDQSRRDPERRYGPPHHPMSSRRSSSINNASFAKAELSSTNSIPGFVFLTNFAHRPTSRCEEVPAKPRRTRPVVPLPAADTAISAIRHASRISRAGSSSASPAAVSRTVRVLRSNNGEPSCFSNCLIVRLSGGCAIRSRCAARPKCSSSATARKALI